MHSVIKNTVKAWSDDSVSQMSAALAYYAVFSLVPLLVIAITIVGFVFGEQTAQSEIIHQISGWVGPDQAQGIANLITLAHVPRNSIATTVIGAVGIIFGALGVFTQLKSSMNAIWKVPKVQHESWVRVIKKIVLTDIVAFVMVMVVGLGVVFSLVASTLISTAASSVPDSFVFVNVVQQILSFFVLTVAFAAVYVILPDVRIPWRNVWGGALTAAVLFSVGQYGMGWYLTHSHLSSTFGAAGALVIALVWIYYSTQIVFIGAEIAHVMHLRYSQSSHR